MPLSIHPLFPYTTLFRSVVIKYGGAAMNDPELREDFARDVVLLKYVGMNPIVVHGGGPEITRYMERLDLPVEFVGGLRVSDEADRKSTRLNSSHLGISYAALDPSTLPLHDALPICRDQVRRRGDERPGAARGLRARRRAPQVRGDEPDRRARRRAGDHPLHGAARPAGGVRRRPASQRRGRSEEHTSELQSLRHLVCRSRSIHSSPTRRSSDLS